MKIAFEGKNRRRKELLDENWYTRVANEASGKWRNGNEARSHFHWSVAIDKRMPA